MGNLIFDFKLALRSLARSPAYSFVAFTMFALGLGLTVFMFGGVKGYLLTQMPFPQPEQLVFIDLEEPATGSTEVSVPPFHFAAWRERQQVFEALAGYSIGTVNLTWDDGPERYSGAFVTEGLFETLRQPPALGRLFRAADMRPDAPLTIVIGADMWRHRFNEDPAIAGRRVRVNGQTAEIIGVMPAGFKFPMHEEVWVAQQQAIDPANPTDGVHLTVFARLRDGISPVQAGGALQVLHSALLAEFNDADTASRVALGPLRERFIPDTTRQVVTTLFVSVVLVLLIACSNVANLTLARVASRRREIAIRASLGAGRRRLIGGILLEVVLISLAGAALGLVLAELGGQAIDRAMLGADEMPAYWVDGTTDYTVVAFAFGAALFSALAAGFVPAWSASRGDLQAGLRDGSYGSSDGSGGRLARTLVVAQLVLCCVLLISAGLTLRSAINVNQVDDGLGQRNALTGRIGLFEATYPTAADQMRVYERIQEELAALPGARGATLTSALPMVGGGSTRFAPEGAEYQPGARLPGTNFIRAMPNLFDVFGVPLLRGRALSTDDHADAPRVAIVNASLAAREWPDTDAVGQRIRLGDTDGPLVTIVGVVANFIQHGADFTEAGIRPALYVPLAQDTVRFVSFAVATDSDPHLLAGPVREAMRRAEPETPIYWLRSFTEVTTMATFMQRLLAILFSVFAVIGLTLAATGMYAVMASAVAQRTREIGVRRALGASDRIIMRMILGQSGRQYLIGISLGLLLAAGFARMLASILVGVHALDPLTFGGVVALLGLIVALAAWLPARGALKIEPMVALRQD